MSMKNEKYKSMAAMKKHEKSEGKKEMMMEYGKVKKKPAVKKPTLKKKGK
jgi:quinol monooxygenase YgiN